MNNVIEVQKPTKGLFWLIDGELLAIPFDKGKYLNAVAKSGVNGR